MSYLTNDERKMEFSFRRAQYFLGMQCSLNKRDGKELKELLNELIDDALQEGRKQGALEELKKQKLFLQELDYLRKNLYIGSEDDNKLYLLIMRELKRIKELEKEGVEQK